MIAFKAHFDGENIIPPEELRAAIPREVIVVFDNSRDSPGSNDRELWLKAQEASLARVWENDADAVYDNL